MYMFLGRLYTMKFNRIRFLLIFTFSIILSLQTSILSSANEYAVSPSDLVAESAVLINQTSGQVIFDKNANTPMYPASTTKVLAAIIILEDLPLDEVVTIDAASPYAGGSAIALEPGETLTVEQLLYALMITSANDAAEALAIHHSGSIEAFAAVMNERAAEMGAVNSNFENPHGLPNPNHLTTAYDLALIAQRAMKNEVFRNIVQTRRYEIPPTNMKSETRYLNSTNSFYQGIEGSNDLISIRGVNVPIAYEYVTGIKRGYTDEAMNCLISSATKDDKSYISVVLKSNGNSMYADSRLLLDYGLFGVQSFELLSKDVVVENVNLNNKRKTVIPLVLEQTLRVDLTEGVDPTLLEKKIAIESTIDLPVMKGEVLGTISYYYGETQVASAKLVSQDDFAGEDLVNSVTTFFASEERPLFSKSWFFYVITRFVLAVLLWRTIMTFLRLQKRKRKKSKRSQSRATI